MQVTLKTNDDVRAGIQVFITGPISQDDLTSEVPEDSAPGVVALWRAIATSEGSAEVTASLSDAYDAKRLLSSPEVAFGVLMIEMRDEEGKDARTIARGLDDLALQLDHEFVRLTDEEGANAVVDAMVPDDILALVRESGEITEEEFHRLGVEALETLSQRVHDEQVSA